MVIISVLSAQHFMLQLVFMPFLNRLAPSRLLFSHQPFSVFNDPVDTCSVLVPRVFKAADAFPDLLLH